MFRGEPETRAERRDIRRRSAPSDPGRAHGHLVREYAELIYQLAGEEALAKMTADLLRLESPDEYAEESDASLADWVLTMYGTDEMARKLAGRRVRLQRFSRSMGTPDTVAELMALIPALATEPEYPPLNTDHSLSPPIRVLDIEHAVTAPRGPNTAGMTRTRSHSGCVVPLAA